MARVIGPSQATISGTPSATDTASAGTARRIDQPRAAVEDRLQDARVGDREDALARPARAPAGRRSRGRSGPRRRRRGTMQRGPTRRSGTPSVRPASAISCSRTSWAWASVRKDSLRWESLPPADWTTTSDRPVSRASRGRPRSTAWIRSNRTCRCWRNSTPVRSSMRVSATRNRENRHETQAPAMMPSSTTTTPIAAHPRCPWVGSSCCGAEQRVRLLRDDVGQHGEERDTALEQRRQGVQVPPLPPPEPARVHRAQRAAGLRGAAGPSSAHRPARCDSPRAASRSRSASASAVGRPGDLAAALGRGGVQLDRGHVEPSLERAGLDVDELQAAVGDADQCPEHPSPADHQLLRALGPGDRRDLSVDQPGARGQGDGDDARPHPEPFQTKTGEPEQTSSSGTSKTARTSSRAVASFGDTGRHGIPVSPNRRTSRAGGGSARRAGTSAHAARPDRRTAPLAPGAHGGRGIHCSAWDG